jgi:hypothetical protein
MVYQAVLSVDGKSGRLAPAKSGRVIERGQGFDHGLFVCSCAIVFL